MLDQKEKKIGSILKNNGITFTSPSNRPKKIIPLFIDPESVQFERNQIIKNHNIFTNEINSNYTNIYLDNVSDLLFNNEKLYYKKRNKLTIDNPTLPEIRTPTKIPQRKDSSYFLSSSSQRSNSVNCNSLGNRGPYYSKDFVFDDILKNKNRNSNRIVEMEHLSNKMNKVYCKNFKKLLIRRIDGVKDIATTASPKVTKRKLNFHSYNKTSINFNTPSLHPLGHIKNNHSSIMNRSAKLFQEHQ